MSAAWIQAHGHAQIFGWIGTFILGIGFYSIPKLRRLNSFALSAVWSSWALWTGGVTLRWLISVYQWHWRALLPLSAILEFAAFLIFFPTLLPLSAALELAAFAIFFRTVSGHRPQDSDKNKLEDWVFVVIAGSVGLLLTLLVNFGLHGFSPFEEYRQKYQQISTNVFWFFRLGDFWFHLSGDSAQIGFLFF